jgi:hypothetical protein
MHKPHSFQLPQQTAEDTREQQVPASIAWNFAVWIRTPNSLLRTEILYQDRYRQRCSILLRFACQPAHLKRSTYRKDFMIYASSTARAYRRTTSYAFAHSAVMEAETKQATISLREPV